MMGMPFLLNDLHLSFPMFPRLWLWSQGCFDLRIIDGDLACVRCCSLPTTTPQALQDVILRLDHFVDSCRELLSSASMLELWPWWERSWSNQLRLETAGADSNCSLAGRKPKGALNDAECLNDLKCSGRLPSVINLWHVLSHLKSWWVRSAKSHYISLPKPCAAWQK
jgi:hypothetical protein